MSNIRAWVLGRKFSKLLLSMKKFPSLEQWKFIDESCRLCSSEISSAAKTELETGESTDEKDKKSNSNRLEAGEMLTPGWQSRRLRVWHGRRDNDRAYEMISGPVPERSRGQRLRDAKVSCLLMLLMSCVHSPLSSSSASASSSSSLSSSSLLVCKGFIVEFRFF